MFEFAQALHSNTPLNQPLGPLAKRVNDMPNDDTPEIEELRRFLEEIKDQLQSVKANLDYRSDQVDQLEAKVHSLEERLTNRAQPRSSGPDKQKDSEPKQEGPALPDVPSSADQPDEDESELLKRENQDPSAREQATEPTPEDEDASEDTVEPNLQEPEREHETDDTPSKSSPDEPDDRTDDLTPDPSPEEDTMNEQPLAEVTSSTTAGSTLTETTSDDSDPRSVFVKLEQYLTGYGYMVIGVIALLFGSGFLLKHAYEEEWLSAIMTDTHKVIAGTILGVLLILAGEFLVRINRSYFARGLFGLALGWLYFLFYAGFHLFDIFSQNMAGGYMAAVTSIGLILAIRHRSRLIAHLSLIGGFLTPWLISTGSASTVPLFLYITALLTGFLPLSVWMNWSGLDVTAQIGTGTIFFSWFVQYFSINQFSAAAVFFWIFYGLLFTSCFIKYRWWLDGVDRKQQADHDEPVPPTLLVAPYSLLPIFGFGLLVLIYQENVPSDLFIPGGGASIFALGASYFVASSFLSQTRTRYLRNLQYLIGLGIVAIGLLVHIGNEIYPQWIVALLLGGLYVGYHLVRLWQHESYYIQPIPRVIISAVTYGGLMFWFLNTPPENDVVIPLLSLVSLFLIDHLTASYRFLFEHESEQLAFFPYHYTLGCLLFLSGGAALLSGVVGGAPASIQIRFPWFCYGFGGVLLVEHLFFVRDRKWWVRYLVQSILMLNLIIAPVFQSYELQLNWTAILPVSAGFLISYEAMLWQLDIEEDWLFGMGGFLIISGILFAQRPTMLNIRALLTFSGILFLSFLRIPHGSMLWNPDETTTRDDVGLWILFTGLFFGLNLAVEPHPHIIRHSVWAIVFLALVLGYHLLYSDAQRHFRSYSSMGLLLGGFAHLHLLFRKPIDAVESWTLLFPFLILILLAGELQERTTVDENGDVPVSTSLLRSAFLYAIPLFAYSLFFADLLFYHRPSIITSEASQYFQRPIVHEVMLTFVTVLVAAGPIWKKIRRNRNIQWGDMVLFQISLLLFYIASFFVGDEFNNVHDWLIPVLLAPVMFGMAHLLSERWFDDRRQKMLYLVNGFLMTTHGILIAFEHQYQTLFLGLDAVLFFTLARMYRWKWIPSGSLIAALWLGLHLCWSSFVTQSVSPGEGLTLDFLIRCAGLLVLLVIPYAAHRFPTRNEPEFDFPLESLVVSSVALLALYLGNLKLFSYFGWYESEIHQHFDAFMYSLSALWGGAGLVYFLFGFLMNYRFLRMFGSLIIMFTTIKVFFFDLNVEMIWRVFSFFTLGSLLLVINYIYRSYLEPEKEN